MVLLPEPGNGGALALSELSDNLVDLYPSLWSVGAAFPINVAHHHTKHMCFS